MENKLVQTSRFAFLILSLSLVFPVHGTTIARVGSEELVNKAELIFEGVVISARPDMDHRGYIYTYVDFLVNDVLVGNAEIGSTLTLRFTGGTVGDIGLDVGASIPKLNERGIYFVEQVTPGLVNPLLGWSQGHFIVNDDGSVVAGNTQVVQAVERRSSKNLRQFSEGVAYGISTRPQPDTTDKQQATSEMKSQPMSVEEFKRKILALKY